MDFIWLVFAHYIGDIALQNDWLARYKCQQWYAMLSHCIIWTACTCAALEYAGLLQPWKVPFLIVGHFAVDRWKCGRGGNSAAWKWMYVDQLLHLVQLVLVYLVP